MQLIAVGDIVINLDRVTALDIDRENNALILKVHGDSSTPVITATVGPELLGQLLEMVPQHLRFRGRDT
jgi:hypothetical protein